MDHDIKSNQEPHGQANFYLNTYRRCCTYFCITDYWCMHL